MPLNAQHTGLPLGNEAYHILDRLEIKTGLERNFHSTLKYHLRSDAVIFIEKVNEARLPISINDRRDLFYIFRDNNEVLLNQEESESTKNEQQKIYTDSTNTFYSLNDEKTEVAELSPFYFESKKPLLALSEMLMRRKH